VLFIHIQYIFKELACSCYGLSFARITITQMQHMLGNVVHVYHLGLTICVSVKLCKCFFCVLNLWINRCEDFHSPKMKITHACLLACLLARLHMMFEVVYVCWKMLRHIACRGQTHCQQIESSLILIPKATNSKTKYNQTYSFRHTVVAPESKIQNWKHQRE